MHPHEIKLVRQYAMNEIAGGIMLAQFALKTDDSFVRAKLTYHAYDEFRHGWLWTEFLEKQGVGVQGAQGKNEYFEFMAAQDDVIDFLSAAHVYELRIPFHLGLHMQLSQISSELKKVMGPIKDDEKYHLGWVRAYLIKRIETDRNHVLDALRKAEAFEQDTYGRYVAHLKQYGEYFGAFASLLEQHLAEFPLPSNSFLSVA